MLPSTRALLSQIADYAGLFPPAQLPMEQAVQNYARYRTETENWMLGSFVCPVEGLAALAANGTSLFLPKKSFRLSVIVATTELDEILNTVVPALGAFHERHGEYAVLGTAEFRLSFASMSENESKLKNLRRLLAIGPMLPVAKLFFEHDTPDDFSATIMELRSFDQAPLRRFGYKLRCGGQHASAIPSIEHVAHVITSCRDAVVPLKFTAGLHHPTRRFDAGVQAHIHGFLNVFGAGILAHARQLSEAQIAAIVADENASHFVFTADGFRWNDHFASVAEIAAARQKAVISFGSCSFDEPRDDLHRLGLL